MTVNPECLPQMEDELDTTEHDNEIEALRNTIRGSKLKITYIFLTVIYNAEVIVKLASSWNYLLCL